MSSSTSTPVSLSSLTYLKPTTVADFLLEPSEKAKIAIIDVRDDDHVGGNINGSQWVPLNQLDVKMPELVRTLKDKEKVIFHCMLSQQRGPKAALSYARAIQRAEEKKEKETAEEAESKPEGEESKAAPKQEVCVLEGGFGSWQARYGENPRLTADYEADIWV
jgi:rhodanese-related sulfurtransferase